jgi:hypothetical protein
VVNPGRERAKAMAATAHAEWPVVSVPKGSPPRPVPVECLGCDGQTWPNRRLCQGQVMSDDAEACRLDRYGDG